MFVFDAYGTLLDVDAAARRLPPSPEWEALKDYSTAVAKGWRERQIRYSWLCSMMGQYDDFGSLRLAHLMQH